MKQATRFPPMREKKTQKQSGLTDWGAIRKHAKEIPDVHPRIRFDPKGEDGVKRAKVRILESEPHLVSPKKGAEKQFDPFLAFVVLDLKDGTKKSLAFSAKSLQNEMGKIANEHKGDLMNVEVLISTETYDHKEYGRTTAYRVSELGEDSTNDAEKDGEEEDEED